MTKEIPIEVSARHIHLSQNDLEALFGQGYQLRKLKQLTQPGDFAAEETLDIRKRENRLEKLRIVGPLREKTQVELSMTDALILGINPAPFGSAKRCRVNPPLRLSGSLKGTPGAVLIGPKKRVKIKEGIIIALRHLHCNPDEAKELGLKDKERVSVKIEGERGLVFENVLVRVSEEYSLCVHLDTDEGNAAGIIKKGKGMIIDNFKLCCSS